MLHLTDIQRFSIHDGSGIRTTVFLKGCNLNCFWCHNPETISRIQEIKFISQKCIQCGNCIDACPYGAKPHEAACQVCLNCVDHCPTKALQPVMKTLHSDKLLSVLRKDTIYYRNSGGGVTFSGGEPLLQSKALQGVLHSLKQEGIHTAIDTAGNVAWEEIKRVINDTDLFLYDIKFFNDALHQKATGCSNKNIIQNLHFLSTAKQKIWIRIPLIGGWNDNDIEINHIGQLLSTLNGIERVELLPLHTLGESKYKQLGRTVSITNAYTPSQKQIDRLSNILAGYGLPIQINC